MDLFIRLEGQWRVGPGGPYGMDFGAVRDTMEMLGIPQQRWKALFLGIKVMADAALLEMLKKDGNG